MPKKNKAVDAAMASERPEKRAIRQLWADHFCEYHDLTVQELLYLSLTGEDAKDIDTLIDQGVVDLNDAGQISDEWLNRIAAIESRPKAILALSRKYPGLKIYQINVKDLVRGEGLLVFPDNPGERSACRSRVINLDLNTTLAANTSDGEIEFPVIRWIEKFGLLHTDKPRLEWSLYLTLHGELVWSERVRQYVVDFMKDNFQRSPKFRADCGEAFGKSILADIEAKDLSLFDRLDKSLQQKFLMAFVPKQIASSTIQQTWSIETLWNLAYGDAQQGHAPMVSWIFHLTRSHETQQKTYETNVGRICTALTQVKNDGSFCHI